ncbi:hypothetical protein HPP92_006758 [Vanilla planifolia]|uniref:non-specific serine/threonine protein kinase n=1 Tax=Vanilla planifolia TaxID=51239 RepID=A0A835RL30_VANPL|nr:hypothetical protein HPP92_006758 [Vanilla planifolia]
MRIQGAVAAVVIAVLIAGAEGLGSAATVAIVGDSGTVCGILAGTERRSIQCARVGRPAFSILPNFSFDSVSGGSEFLCGLKSGGHSFFCWSADDPSSDSLTAKRVYNGAVVLTDLSVGKDQVCAFERNTTRIRWWRGHGTFPTTVDGDFRSLTSGRGFSCGIGSNDLVQCWGSRGSVIQSAFQNLTIMSIVAGDSHVCGISIAGLLFCKGSNSSGQLIPSSGVPFQFSDLALG